MTKTRILSIAVVLLIVLNLGMMAFFMSKKPHGPHRNGGPKHIVVERLHFDEDQVVAYEATIQEHRSSVEELENEMRDLRSELYSLLNTKDRSAKDSITSAIGAVQQQIEELHFAHFAEIEALCREDQKAAFQELSTELVRIFSKGPPERHPHK